MLPINTIFTFKMDIKTGKLFADKGLLKSLFHIYEYKVKHLKYSILNYLFIF